MIRFSAGLVVVALGVLIGGVVTSKLSLVYVSIAISVVALIAWAVGVFLKRGELREELFGGRPELVPAGAGVGAGLPAPGRPSSVPQSPAPSTASPVPWAGQDRPAYGQDGFDAAAFSSPAQVRAWGGAKEPPAPVGAGTPLVGAGSPDARRSWFDRPAAQAQPPVQPATVPVSDTDTSGDVDVSADEVDVSADEDDDWPTRYSWLDDEEADEAVESDDVALPEPTEEEPTEEDEPSAGRDSAAKIAIKMVTVVPGVPRYHEPNCVLIRFMPEGDVKKLSVEAAKDTGCTPCAACQPAG